MGSPGDKRTHGGLGRNGRLVPGQLGLRSVSAQPVFPNAGPLTQIGTMFVASAVLIRRSWSVEGLPDAMKIARNAPVANGLVHV